MNATTVGELIELLGTFNPENDIRIVQDGDEELCLAIEMYIYGGIAKYQQKITIG